MTGMRQNAASLHKASWNSGLSPQEVQRSRAEHGSNRLTVKPPKSFARHLWESFQDPIIRVLLGALLLNAVLLFHAFTWYESLGIALSICIATLVSTLSERGSEKAFSKLQEEAAHSACQVLRGGKRALIPTEQLVQGDILIIRSGERIPADGLLLEGGLQVDQSALNGESREVSKTPGSALPSHSELSDPHLLFRGSLVCSGQGIMRVLRVGDASIYGTLASEVQDAARSSPLRVRLEKLAKTISRIGYVGAAVVGLADLFRSVVLGNGMDPAKIPALLRSPADLGILLLHALTMAVTVIVVAVPEGLPMMITVVLSANTRRMLKDQVLVRKLVGIETSGSLNILFTDKTGTLTEGKLALAEIRTADEQADSLAALKSKVRREALRLGMTGCNESTRIGRKPVGGNGTDRALLAAVPISQMPDFQVQAQLPFDSVRKYAAVTLQTPQGLRHFVKGAPDLLLRECIWQTDRHGKRVPLQKSRWEEQLHSMMQQGLRVVAMAESENAVDASHEPRNLCILALLGLQDRLRPEVPKAVTAVRRAGVQVVMITGDHADTAACIARAAGILDDEAYAPICTGEELRRMDDRMLRQRLPDLRVIARAQPQDKTRLIRIAQEMGLVAGMTGDGINDAPALKKADVGFGMGSGTEVAREAADIVILDDRFASIVQAIHYGRTIFKSIRKFIVFQLTMNLCAVGISAIAPMIGFSSPITVIQMLWVNIIMDTLAGLAFAGEAPTADSMREPPKRRDESVFTREMLGQVLWVGLYSLALCFFYLLSPITRNLFGFAENRIYFMTGFFVLFIFCAVCNSFNLRTSRLFLPAGLGKNPSFAVIMLLVAAVQMAMVYCGGTVFRTTGLALPYPGKICLMAATVLPADLLRKGYLRLRREHRT